MRSIIDCDVIRRLEVAASRVEWWWRRASSLMTSFRTREYGWKLRRMTSPGVTRGSWGNCGGSSGGGGVFATSDARFSASGALMTSAKLADKLWLSVGAVLRPCCR